MRFSLSLLLAALLPTFKGAVLAEPTTGSVGVQNPKELVAPVKLVAADLIMDGGSLCGRLAGADGQQFVFFLGLSLFEDGRHGLYVGFDSGYIPESARANFSGWTMEDFCSILEGAIGERFHAQPPGGRLVPNDPHESPTSFAALAAGRLLRYCERHREHLKPGPERTPADSNSNPVPRVRPRQ